MSSLESLKQSHPSFGPEAQEPEWLTARRQAGLARFAELGFPSTKSEAWKYSSTRRLDDAGFVHHTGPVDAEVLERVAASRLADAAAELVFVDGRYAPELSRVADGAVTARPLSDVAMDASLNLDDVLGKVAKDASAPFLALNDAFLQDGLLVHAPRLAELDGLIHVLHIIRGDVQPLAAHPRVVVLAETGSRVSVAESFVGLGAHPTLINAITELSVGAGARVDHALLGVEGEGLHVVVGVSASLSRDATLSSHTAWLGTGWARADLHITLSGPGAQATMDGLEVLGRTQHADTRLLIEHAVPHTSSAQGYKGVLGGRARGVFDGKVVVHEGASGTQAAQRFDHILLSEDADGNARPQLEIYHDDVKCSHGTTIGQLDATQLSYLRSRGIPKTQAARMLTEAFVADRVLAARHPVWRAHLDRLVGERMHTVLDAEAAS